VFNNLAYKNMRSYQLLLERKIFNLRRMQKNHSLNQTGSIWLKNVHFLNQPKNQFCNFFAEAYKTHRIQFKSTGDFFGNSFRKKNRENEEA
jgi:hypothetical protein